MISLSDWCLQTSQFVLQHLDVVNGFQDNLKLAQFPRLLKLNRQHLSQLLHVGLADVVGVEVLELSHDHDVHCWFLIELDGCDAEEGQMMTDDRVVPHLLFILLYLPPPRPLVTGLGFMFFISPFRCRARFLVNALCHFPFHRECCSF